MIIQLTEAQRSVLEPACNREDLCAFPITAALKGGAVGNVCKSLLRRGLLEEVPAADTNTVFRHDESGTPLTLIASGAGKQAVAGEPVAGAVRASVPAPSAAPVLPQAKVSRQDTLLSLLGRPQGATIADMAEATGWQAHSVRGALSGIIGKKLGLKVVSEKLPERGRVYRVR
jgi:hypothetical protein